MSLLCFPLFFERFNAEVGTSEHDEMLYMFPKLTAKTIYNNLTGKFRYSNLTEHQAPNQRRTVICKMTCDKMPYHVSKIDSQNNFNSLTRKLTKL